MKLTSVEQARGGGEAVFFSLFSSARRRDAPAARSTVTHSQGARVFIPASAFIFRTLGAN